MDIKDVAAAAAAEKREGRSLEDWIGEEEAKGVREFWGGEWVVRY